MRALVCFLWLLPVWADTGNAVCARCHGEIARKYAVTGMARSSGKVGQAARKENFGHPNVAAGYRLQVEGATRPLEFFLGSGHIGHSYLFRKGAQLFQAPLSYYSAPGQWDVSPGYENRPFLELTRAVEPGCLQCHTTPGRPFQDPGVSCERCHGPGEKHAAAPSRRNIVQPARLAPLQRDSVCAQCHLTGAARISRAGRERGSYVPGEALSDSIAVFVQAGSAVTATSHFERLAASRCKQASGDRLWCGTCHSPHAEASTAGYNRQCQSCHSAGSCKRSTEGNCVSCHMPKRGNERSISHLAFTDHGIPRRPAGAGSGSGVVETLREFWSGVSNPRDTAMGYAAAGNPAAYPLLEEAARNSPRDVPLLSQLAQFHERAGQEEKAERLYEQILQLDPANPTAAVNLGIARIKKGKAQEAMALWQGALARSPWLIGARLNLAVAQYQSGNPAGAKASLQAVLDYEPAHAGARQMLLQIP